ncbi:MAG: universal stress protein [Desulfurococcaceae archaeon]
MVVERRYEVSFMFRKILVPVDGSENSYRALELALDFAARYGSRVDVLYVEVGGETEESVRREVLRRAQDRKLDVNFLHKKCDLRTSSVSTEILRSIIEGGYDTVIIGARGKSINEEVGLGSTALSVAVNSPTNIIIVR